MKNFLRGFKDGAVAVLKLRGALTYSSIVALAALAFGVEIGTDEVTKIVAGLVTLAGLYGRWRTTRR